MSAYLARQLARCQPTFFRVLAGRTHPFHSDLLILAYRKMECFQCRCSSPSLSDQCSPDVSLTEEELELLKTKPRDLTEEDQRRRKALRERLRRGGRSPGTKARDNIMRRYAKRCARRCAREELKGLQTQEPEIMRRGAREELKGWQG